ncbi:hypothetical protein AA0472_1859 [Acetobacter estunensis NRIC 0472]|uniref:SWI2/SNF2 ATPase domain-containing protein n=1 Tax=Acetobacter estunensis TaxID=104097 RepID=A0A967EIG4_9PROT|nr:hypothetical protein [Acetobacter estunensis]NHO55417.1 hypothetical protein [Acetobacter estunensis]GBQ25719.1 hypothetical protein AA0472_1859 [Acetobacter estunensis NRIC 0472]
MPNAAFITFTGTPLLKGSETVSRFGKIIHSYTMQQTVSDGKAPRDCIDCVILDELCHPKERKSIANILVASGTRDTVMREP